MASTSQKQPVDMKYSLTDITTEPSDEQLSQLMKEVAEEAKQKSEKAKSAFFQNMYEYIREQTEKYSTINIKLDNA